MYFKTKCRTSKNKKKIMTRKEALEKLMAETPCSIDQIIIIQRSLKWYDQEIDDKNWYEHIYNIVDLYVQSKSSVPSSLIR